MGRTYELKRRAERQQETRLRIVEAAIELHRTKGPARTTISDIARLAGVQRHTLYRHFPDERAIGLACSGLYMERNGPPDGRRWRQIADLDERLRTGLGEVYAWYEQNEDMFANVLRDAEAEPVWREIFELRSGKAREVFRDVLAEAVPGDARGRALLDLALDFHTWRRLARSGLTAAEAAQTMAAALRCR